MSHGDELNSKGFTVFPFDDAILEWVTHAATLAPAILADPVHEKWWRHGRSWFVGVDALPNDASGRIPGGPALQGHIIDFIARHLGFAGPWHRGQLSVCFPGYPLRDPHETDGQHNFRLKRDAAHVDGLHAEGNDRRRHLREAHQFILGLPLNVTETDAAPLTIWEGSQLIMARMFDAVLAGVPAANHGEIDFTTAYHEARQQCFATCRRTIVHARPGSAYIIHRHALHGVAPWALPSGREQSRIIAYFRPLIDK